MRIFADSSGHEWTVFEVKRRASDDTRWKYLPDGFGEGWLCFESETSKRRLTPVPERWDQLSTTRLEDLLWKAKPVARIAHSGRNGADSDSRVEDQD